MKTDGQSAVQMLLFIGGLSLVPAMLFTVTGFTRILIVLGFIRSGLGTNTAPPNQVLVGIALFLTIFVMAPVFKQVKSSREEKASGAGLKTLATLPLGQNRAMHLVRAGDEVVLVGVGEGGVTPIRTYGENEARALGLLADDEPLQDVIEIPASDVTEVRPTFTQALTRSLDGLRKRTVIK